MARGAPNIFSVTGGGLPSPVSLRRWLGCDPTLSAASMATWSGRVPTSMRAWCGELEVPASCSGTVLGGHARAAFFRGSWLSGHTRRPGRRSALGGIGLPVHAGQVAASQKHDAARAIGHVVVV